MMGGPRRTDRVENDFYPTDPEIIRKGMRCLRSALAELEIPFQPTWCIEPASGPEAPFGQVAAETFGSLEHTVVTVDLSPAAADSWSQRRRLHFAADFFDWTAVHGKQQFDFAPTNPPYNKAEEFMRATAGWLLTEMGLGFFLLRLGFLESQLRFPLWTASEVHLCHLSVLASRPSFLPGGGTDQTSYGFYTFCRTGSAMAKLWTERAGRRPLLDWIE